MSLDTSKTTATKPWYEAYPPPTTKTPPQISRQDLRKWISEGKVAGKDYIVIDVRGSDHVGGFLRHSLNLPIESLYPTLPVLHTLFSSAGIKTVIWYCVTSRGRGNRAAAWFGDYLSEHGDSSIESVALYEGILGWVLEGEEYRGYVEEFVPQAWRSEDKEKHVGELK